MYYFLLLVFFYFIVSLVVYLFIHFTIGHMFECLRETSVQREPVLTQAFVLIVSPLEGKCYSLVLHLI